MSNITQPTNTPLQRSALLVLNAGSSSIKFAVYHRGNDRSLQCTHRGSADITDHNSGLSISKPGSNQTLTWPTPPATPDTSPHEAAIRAVLQWFEQEIGCHLLLGVGHRVVHGGRTFITPVRLNPHVVSQLRELIPLAPLHQPHHLAAIEAVTRAQPDLPQVACFDTAFHCAAPRLHQLFALPRALSEAGIVRYGFHGLSYEYICSVLVDHIGTRADGRIVIAHLGNGASLCAVHQRQAIATTMSFTPLDGLAMGTRCGQLDPGVIFYLARERGMTLAQIEHMLWYESGLLGTSGSSGDMRTLLDSTDPHAQEAVALFCHRIKLELGAMVAALGGLDALIFTGGIGEHAALIRARVCTDARWLGIQLDEEKNNLNASRISTEQSPASAWVIPTNEDWVIANHTCRMLDPM